MRFAVRRASFGDVPVNAVQDCQPVKSATFDPVEHEWFVEIETLQQLHELHDKAFVQTSQRNKSLFNGLIVDFDAKMIEIYDDYIE